MSRPEGFETSEQPGARIPDQRPPLFRVMIGCGIAGVLIAIGTAVVDFGTGRHPGSGDGDRFGTVPSVTISTTPPAESGTHAVPAR